MCVTYVEVLYRHFGLNKFSCFKKGNVKISKKYQTLLRQSMTLPPPWTKSVPQKYMFIVRR